MYFLLISDRIDDLGELGHCPMISNYHTLKAQKLVFIDKEQCNRMERVHR